VRPIDLARLAGVSTQQVRNYVEAGILPPAPRTASGYRTFDERHRQALLTYRALAKGHGWEAARQVMLAVHAGDVPAALALVDAGHADLHEQRRSLDAAGEALQAMAGQDLDGAAIPRTGLLIGEVAGHLRIRTSALRVWEAAGLLTPQRERGTGYRRYGPTDVRDARMINLLRQGHYPLTAIRPILDDLRQAGSTGALRAAIAERHADLTRRTRAMLEAAGHLNTYLLMQRPEEGADVGD
jgi:DNA-binding transcriptional MerR regulator